MTNYYRNLCIFAVIGTIICVVCSIVFSFMPVGAIACVLSAYCAYLFSVVATENYRSYREWKSWDEGEPPQLIKEISAHQICNACEGDKCPHHRCKYSVINFNEDGEIEIFTCGRKENNDVST